MRSVVNLILALALLALPAAAQAAPGDLDGSFSGDGLLRTTGLPTAVAAPADGSVVVAGAAGSSGVSRFGPGGETSWSFGFPGHATAVESGPPDQVVVGGMAGSGPTADFLVTRLALATGDPLTGAPMVADFNGGDDRLTDIAVAPDGSIAAVGLVAGPAGDHLGVARFGPDNAPDPAFNGGSPLTFAQGGGFGEDAALAALADGGTVVAGAGPAPDGSGAGDLLVAKLAADGALDPGFGGGDGWVTVDVGGRDDARSIALQSGGRIVVGFEACATGLHTSCDQAVARFSAAGAPDPSFGGDGVVVGTAGSEVADGGAGRVLVGGYTDPRQYFQRDFAVTRLLDDGAPDPGFSGDGTATADFRLSEDLAVALAVSPDGRPVLVGRAGDGAMPTGAVPDQAIARFVVADGPADADADGVLDAEDACPQRYSLKRAGCPKEKRSLKLKRAARGKLRATLKSGFAPCEARQRLKVVRRNDGKKRTFARPRTNNKGNWVSPKRVPAGRYRAIVDARVAAEIVRCASDRSPQKRGG